MDKLWCVYENGKYFDYIYQKKEYFNGIDFFYKEIYDFEWSPTKCIYEMSGCLIEENDIVVDIGAHVGLFTHFAAKKCKKVIAIEGSTETFSCLVKNNIENENVDFLNAKIIVDNQTSDYDVWYKKHSKFSIRLEDIFDLCQIETIDFLKIDIEGTVLDIFRNISPYVVKKIKKIAMEWHYSDDRISEIKPLLVEKKMFYFDWYYNQNKPRQKTLYFYDY